LQIPNMKFVINHYMVQLWGSEASVLLKYWPNVFKVRTLILSVCVLSDRCCVFGSADTGANETYCWEHPWPAVPFLRTGSQRWNSDVGRRPTWHWRRHSDLSWREEADQPSPHLACSTRQEWVLLLVSTLWHQLCFQVKTFI